MPSIGILAYGSLIADPRDELRTLEAERRTGIQTPFRVEYARKSRTRADAPTLVPVTTGGAYVRATLLVLRNDTDLELARDALYRREIDKVGDDSFQYRPDPATKNQVYVELMPDWCGLDWVLYTRIEANILGTGAAELARLAVASAQDSEVRQKRQDGISYLIAARTAGVETPLSGSYEEEICRLTDTESLDHAWESIGQ